jgi:hypothetical protein
MEANPQSTKEVSLRQLSEDIAKALGNGWTRSSRYDNEHNEEPAGRDWRARLENGEESLFLSNTWAGKGKLHVSGWYPDKVQHDTAQRIGNPPSINVSITKSAEQIAKDITHRLLPEYREMLAKVLTQHAEDVAFRNGTEEIKKEVAKIINGTLRNGSDTVHGAGTIDVQVSSPTSLRLTGHCLYVSLDQLRKIKSACPELFTREEK